MQVLVTGGAGYIGSQTAKALAKTGHEVLVLDDLSGGHRWAVKWGQLLEGDILNSDFLRRLFQQSRIEAVIHFAGVIQVGESVKNPSKYFQINTLGTLKLLDAMVQQGVKHMVFSSSAAIYGTPQRIPIPEDHPASPVSPYGESKLFVERILRWYGHAYGIRWAALRYFNASGADPDGEIGEDHKPESHLIPLVIKAALGQIPQIEIYGTDYPTPDGTAIRDYIHVSDLAEGHGRALHHLVEGGESCALNLGTGRGHSVREVIHAVNRCAAQQSRGARSAPFREAPRRAGDPPSLVADPSRAQKVLKWAPQHSSLEEIVTSAWAWHSSQGGGEAP
ncbi:MAG: UDP-glucose 4-epimerase GalE [Terriglobia bacterium]